ncbi:MAG: uroporphyrinogen-III C-methyltransferase [Solirubrobacterales bacterium]|nr:uroporphyrinogen-III C-methyltransferase [Solirubrobacterales bacterium]
MTRRSLELIAAADVIYYDRLIPPDALEGARPEADLVYVGKEPGRPGLGQAEINRRLVESGRAGLRTVRLKGGDPFLFGRGAEEAEALREAGLEFEVVPGVTAGVAASAYAGIPVTHRDQSAAVTFATGHEDPEQPELKLDLERLARTPGTIVFYMGLGKLGANAEALVRGGRPSTEPVAVIERGTTPEQRVVTGTIETIADRVSEAGLRPPALVVVGEVVSARDRLAWFERRPLFGRSVVVTRARDRASVLAGKLREVGAEAIELPVSRTELIEAEDARVDGPLERFAAEGFDLVCFTSPTGVSAFFGLLEGRGLDSRSFAGAEIAAIGPSTARALSARGLRADHLPERFVAEGMIKALESVPMEGRKVLMARAEEGRDLLPDTLAGRGAEVTVMPVYRTVPEPLSDRDLTRASEADFVTFTSASSVHNFVAAGADPARFGPEVATIGPVTSAAAREAGFTVRVEAERHDLDGLVESIQAVGS